MIDIADPEERSKGHGSDDTNASRHGKDPRYGRVVLSVTTVGALLATIQESALLISLPDMMCALQMKFLTMMWVLLVYLIIITVMVPIFGRLSDMFGRKCLLRHRVRLFTLGSCSCAWPNLSSMDGTLWGIVSSRPLGGAFLFANGAAMIADAFEKERLGFGLGRQPDSGRIRPGPGSGGRRYTSAVGMAVDIPHQCALRYRGNGLGDSPLEGTDRAYLRARHSIGLGVPRSLLVYLPSCLRSPSYHSLWSVRTWSTSCSSSHWSGSLPSL